MDSGILEDKPPLEFMVKNLIKPRSGDKVLQTFLEGDSDPVDYVVNSMKSSVKPLNPAYLKLYS